MPVTPMGANLYHHFHQRTVGAPETPSAQMGESQFAQAMAEIVAGGVPADAVMDAVLEGDQGQIEVWLRGLSHPGAK